MFGRSGIGSAIARRPIVIKLTGDPAFERLRARGVVDGDVDEFQRAGRRAHDARRCGTSVTRSMRRAAHVFTPSSYLRDLVVSWGVDPSHVSVMPNPAPDTRPSASRDELRARFGIEGNTLVFAGRLTAQKSLPVLLEAVAQVEDVSLVIAGRRRRASDRRCGGRATRARRRVRLLGALPRDERASISSVPPMRPCSRRAGRTSRTRSSNRSPSGRPSSRRGPVVSRRWSSTARTACSFPSVTQTRSPLRFDGTSATSGCERACGRTRRPRSTDTARSTCSATSSRASRRLSR